MSLSDSMASVTSGGAFVDNVSAPVASMTSSSAALSSVGAALPSIGSASTALTSMTSAMSAARATLIGQLPIALPAMKAVHMLEKKMEMQDGGISSTAGSGSFSAYFGVFDSIDTIVASAHAAVSSVLTSMTTAASSIAGVVGSDAASIFSSLNSQIPSATIPDPVHPGSTIPNPAYATFMSTNAGAIGALNTSGGSLAASAASAQGSVATQMSTASSMYANGMTSLKSLSFARFCAAPQPAAVSAVIGKLVVPSAVPSVSDFSRADACTATWTSAQLTTQTTSPQSTDRSIVPLKAQPSATAYAASPCSSAQLAAITAQYKAQQDIIFSASATRDTARQALEPWLAVNNFQAVKNNRGASADAEAAYQALYTQLKAQPTWQAYSDAIDAKNAAANEYGRLLNIWNYMATTGPWPGNPNGPW